MLYKQLNRIVVYKKAYTDTIRYKLANKRILLRVSLYYFIINMLICFCSGTQKNQSFLLSLLQRH